MWTAFTTSRSGYVGDASGFGNIEPRIVCGSSIFVTTPPPSSEPPRTPRLSPQAASAATTTISLVMEGRLIPLLTHSQQLSGPTSCRRSGVEQRCARGGPAMETMTNGENHDRILTSQDEIRANQGRIIANQERILANQEKIKGNQDALAKIVANQQKILGNQDKIAGTQKALQD